MTALAAKCHWCAAEATAYQGWDHGWVPICMPCHLRDCIDPSAHGSKSKCGAAEAREMPSKVAAVPEGGARR